MNRSKRIACLRADADELRADAPSGGDDPATIRYLEAYMLEVAGLRDEVERLKAELEWREASRKRGDALVTRQFADIRKALGDVEQDVPNWDGSPIGLTAAVGNKVKRLEVENAGLRADAARLKAAVQLHYDQRGDSRCHLDDPKLYHDALGICPDPYVTALPPDADMVESCRRYVAQRQHPDVHGKYPMPGCMTIQQLTEDVERLRAEDARLRLACSRDNEEICQVLGLSLGYPRFCDDQENFPGAVEAHGCCTGEHVAVTMAMEAAERIGRLTAVNERLLLERDAAIYREIYPSNDDVSWLVLDGATYHGERCGPFPSQVAAFDSVLSWVKYGLDPANHPMPEVVDYEEDES